MKNKVIEFLENGPRIYTNPENLSEFEGKDNCIINPDLSAVKGVELHHWKLFNNSIIPMTQEEKEHTDKNLDENVFNLQVKIKEVFVDKIVEIIKTIEVPVEKIVEVIKTVEVVKEIIKEVPVEKLVTKVVKEFVEVPVEKIIDRFVDVPRETIVEKIVTKVPFWVWSVVGVETLVILGLLIK